MFMNKGIPFKLWNSLFYLSSTKSNCLKIGIHKYMVFDN